MFVATSNLLASIYTVQMGLFLDQIDYTYSFYNTINI